MGLFLQHRHAQVRVCFVDSYGEAGWQDPKHAYRGRFGA